MKRFEPDYTQLVVAARNREAERLPLYEHGFDGGVVEKIIGEPVSALLAGSFADKVEAIRRIARCGLQLGYDCIPFERGMVSVVQHGQGLMGHAPAIIFHFRPEGGYACAHTRSSRDDHDDQS